MNLPWTYESEEMAGYDCMTDGIKVKDNTGKILFVLDLHDFGQKAGKTATLEQRIESEGLAKFICENANKTLLTRNQMEMRALAGEVLDQSENNPGDTAFMQESAPELAQFILDNL